jgi:hypothetical protein
MPWSGSPPNMIFTRTDGVRTGDDVYAQQAAAPVDMEPTLFDAHDTDMGDAINACFKKDGGNTATANLPMGGFKFTNLGDGSSATDSCTFGQRGKFADATGITDDSDNEQLIFQKTASAVNYLEATNAAVGNAPLLAAQGDDTNIDLDLRPKGSGKLKSNTARIISLAANTAMLFVQTAAPTGWTKSSSHNDKALRVVSGTASSGGSTAFSSVFASRTPQGTVGNTTLTVAQMPAHSHVLSGERVSEDNNNTAGSTYPLREGGGSNLSEFTTASGTADTIEETGGGQSHTHTFTGTAMDFAVHYVDVIIATVD